MDTRTICCVVSTRPRRSVRTPLCGASGGLPTRGGRKACHHPQRPPRWGWPGVRNLGPWRQWGRGRCGFWRGRGGRRDRAAGLGGRALIPICLVLADQFLTRPHQRRPSSHARRHPAPWRGLPSRWPDGPPAGAARWWSPHPPICRSRLKPTYLLAVPLHADAVDRLVGGDADQHLASHDVDRSKEYSETLSRRYSVEAPMARKLAQPRR